MAYEKIVERFYEELANGKMMGRRCKRCGAVEFPPYFICNSCGNLETEWVEISGKAEITNCWLPAMMSTLPQNEVFQPYAIGNVKLEEGTEFNALICGISRKNLNDVLANLPYPCRARIAQREGYHMVVFDIEEGA